MANKHETLVDLFTDIADAIRGKSESPNNEVIISERLITDSYQGQDNEFAEIYLHAYENYVVTINGKKYSCIAYGSEIDGTLMLGDERLYRQLEPDIYPDWIDAEVVHEENVPFCISSEPMDYGVDGFTGWFDWYFWFKDATADSTFKLEKGTLNTKKIVADNFPDEIRAINTQEDLNDELTNQDNLIAQLQAALEGKAYPSYPSYSRAEEEEF